MACIHKLVADVTVLAKDATIRAVHPDRLTSIGARAPAVIPRSRRFG